MKISVITCTGDRQKAFDLCHKYVNRQTLEQFEWIIVDDGEIETRIPKTRDGIEQVIVRQEPVYSPPGKVTVTLGSNLIAGMKAATGDALVFVEDDDWYSPAYLSMMAGLFMRGAELVGEPCAMYYNVRFRRYYQHPNAHYASLAQTGMRRELIPLLREVIMQPPKPGEPIALYDMSLWQQQVTKLLFRYAGEDKARTETGLCIGIKGMPGRSGIGSGHMPSSFYTCDKSLSKLREWIGEDAEAYRANYDGWLFAALERPEEGQRVLGMEVSARGEKLVDMAIYKDGQFYRENSTRWQSLTFWRTIHTDVFTCSRSATLPGTRQAGIAG